MKTSNLFSKIIKWNLAILVLVRRKSFMEIPQLWKSSAKAIVCESIHTQNRSKGICISLSLCTKSLQNLHRLTVYFTCQKKKIKQLSYPTHAIPPSWNLNIVCLSPHATCETGLCRRNLSKVGWVYNNKTKEVKLMAWQKRQIWLIFY